MSRSMEIDGRKIGPDHPPYIIAELSGNHDGDINRALHLIEIAKDSGADAVKFQTYTADSLTIDSDEDAFILKQGTWKGRNLYRLYEEAHTPRDWHPQLFEKAKAVGITAFSAPFSIDDADFLQTLDVPAFKIASNEFTDWPLVAHVAQFGKPMILSTGTAGRDDIADTVSFLRDRGREDFIILHCVSAYPAPHSEANVRTLEDIAARFDVLAGLSDHTLGIAASIAAVARGACMIEKHFTLSRDDGGVDSSFSLEPAELKMLCAETRHAWESLGTAHYVSAAEMEARGIVGRTLCALRDIKAGEAFGPDNIRSLRDPRGNRGIAARYSFEIYGQAATRDIKKHEPITADMLADRERIKA